MGNLTLTALRKASAPVGIYETLSPVRGMHTHRTHGGVTDCIVEALNGHSNNL